MVKLSLRQSTRAQIAFSAFTVLAFLSHYCAGFFFFACLVAPVFTAFIYSEYRRRLVRQPIRNWFSYVFMSLPILTVMFYSYFSHAARHVTRQVHLASYYFQPSGEESVGSFVLRNLRNTFNVFSPVSLENEIIVLSLSLVLLTAAFVCVIGFRPEKGYVLATVPLILLVTIAGSLIAASILGLYPFGGAGRHQFVLYPFMVLSGLP